MFLGVIKKNRKQKISGILATILLSTFYFSCSSTGWQNDNKKKAEETPSSASVLSEKGMNDFKLDLKVHKEILKNGLRIILVEDHRLPIVAYATFFDIGGRHETKGNTGASHFLEHLMFKGAKKYGPLKFDSMIEAMGGSTNAYTTFDNTVYYQSFPAAHLETIVDLEADRMQNLLLEPTAFESERLVVLEERKFRYENSPQGKLYLSMMRAMFEKSPYGGSVIGDVEDLLALNRDQVRTFFKSYYAPNNAVLVVVGDLKVPETLKWINERYGDIPFSPEVELLKKDKDRPEIYSGKPRYQREVKLNGNNPNTLFMLSFPGDPLGTRKAFVMDILSSILGDGESSYLYQNFVVGKKPKFSEVSASNYNLKYSGLFFVSGQLLDGTKEQGLNQELLTTLRSACYQKSKVLTERNLQKTKNQLLTDYYQDIQTNFGLATFLGVRENFFNDYAYYQKELSTYASISLSEVRNTCLELFNSKKSIYLTINNKTKKEIL